MSTFDQLAADYLRLRRRLGHDLKEPARVLPRFAAYLDASGAETLTIQAALTWVQQPDTRPGSTVWSHRMTAVRGFARHLVGFDPRTEVPPADLLPRRNRRRMPYIFSRNDIIALMTAVRTRIPTPLRSATFETLIGLLAVTGMRVREALRLDRADVDLAEGVLVIRDSKFGKSREIPILATTMQALVRYARKRDQALPRPRASTFFVSIAGTPLIYENVGVTFRQLLADTGVGAGSPVRPHIHDLRHSFAVGTLVAWYRNGEDVEALLPRLSTYLGHRDPRSSYWYLSAAPELLALAAGRLEAAGGPTP